MGQSWTVESFTAKLEETGIDVVRTNLAARVYGDPVRDEKAQIAQRWIWANEADAESSKEVRLNALAREANDIALSANALASAANEIAERAVKSAKTANKVAIAAALIAVASIVISVLQL